MSLNAYATINAHLGRTGSWLQINWFRVKWKYVHSKTTERGPTMDMEFMKYTLFF
jgi:hypothetical protein